MKPLFERRILLLHEPSPLWQKDGKAGNEEAYGLKNQHGEDGQAIRKRYFPSERRLEGSPKFRLMTRQK